MNEKKKKRDRIKIAYVIMIQMRKGNEIKYLKKEKDKNEIVRALYNK